MPPKGVNPTKFQHPAMWQSIIISIA